MQRITSHSVRTFSECEPRLVFAPKTCASQLQPHEILRLSRSQCLLTAFLRNPVTFKGVDWKKQSQTQQVLAWTLYVGWKKRKPATFPVSWVRQKPLWRRQVQCCSGSAAALLSVSGFSEPLRSVWSEHSSVFQGERKCGFWLLLRLDFYCYKAEICC